MSPASSAYQEPFAVIDDEPDHLQSGARLRRRLTLVPTDPPVHRGEAERSEADDGFDVYLIESAGHADPVDGPALALAGEADSAESWPTGLDAVESAFRLLVAGPRPLALPGRLLGMRRRSIPLDEVRDLLQRRWVGRRVRDRAWADLVTRARASSAWMVGCTALALPGLRRMAGDLARSRPGPTDDLDAAILAAFIEAVRTVRVDAGWVALTLMRRTLKTVIRARHAEAGPPPAAAGVIESIAPPPPWGHPDLLLADAVRQRIIGALDAELIGATRFEDATIADLAAWLGMTAAAVYKRRRRAELRLAEAIIDGRIRTRLTT